MLFIFELIIDMRLIQESKCTRLHQGSRSSCAYISKTFCRYLLIVGLVKSIIGVILFLQISLRSGTRTHTSTFDKNMLRIYTYSSCLLSPAELCEDVKGTVRYHGFKSHAHPSGNARKLYLCFMAELHLTLYTSHSLYLRIILYCFKKSKNLSVVPASRRMGEGVGMIADHAIYLRLKVMYHSFVTFSTESLS